MTNFIKPSELPADTVIQDKEEDVWMKEESGVWGEMTPHCVDCTRAVNDEGTIEVWMGNEEKLVKADDFFLDFKIIAWPTAVVEVLIDMIEGYELTEWHESDRDEIIQAAIENVKRNNVS